MSAAARNVLTLTIKDKQTLYAAYMPFLRFGGLFIPTTRRFRPGQELFMLLSLIDEPQKLPVAGKIVWVTPQGAQGRRTPGIGLQFNEDQSLVRDKIETYLAGALSSGRPTYTL
ncbi:type IV pilus assembly protein PilZ [Allopseudospirillum japonicum]|uniref:Type IV pilus assembly protein PilZ n=1 Tax=Allopseudospirillum japonicum TaxID=64971 RepID=A0A1H6SBF2_9GAMM|nr:PilZ domain-containing protein [Allopseudospirillum japonicum]SEI61350.1 type IV pilus assembly protein PilZ [Allopseudospirillum japonicum]